MPKIDTLDALNDETTSMLKTLTHSLSFSGSKRYIYIGGNKSFGAHTAESLCFKLGNLQRGNFNIYVQAIKCARRQLSKLWPLSPFCCEDDMLVMISN